MNVSPNFIIFNVEWRDIFGSISANICLNDHKHYISQNIKAHCAVQHKSAQTYSIIQNHNQILD